MKELIQFILKNNFDKILENAKNNVISNGLSEIVLLRSDTVTVKLFVTNSFHDVTTDKCILRSIGCDKTIKLLTGSMICSNYIKSEVGSTYTSYSVTPTGNINTGGELLKLKKVDVMHENDCITLQKGAIYGIEVPAGRVTSWLVFETDEVNPTFYTNNHTVLPKYKPHNMNEEELRYVLKISRL